jgi:uncharacterized protein with GYD domain
MAGIDSVGTTHACERIGYNRWRAERNPQAQEEAVPTYIMLATLTPEGVQTVKNNPARIREVNEEVGQLGATVKAQWATLGAFDFVNIVEAPDEKVMSRVSLELGSRGTVHYETLTAIPIDEFIASL